MSTGDADAMIEYDRARSSPKRQRPSRLPHVSIVRTVPRPTVSRPRIPKPDEWFTRSSDVTLQKIIDGSLQIAWSPSESRRHSRCSPAEVLSRPSSRRQRSTSSTREADTRVAITLVAAAALHRVALASPGGRHLAKVRGRSSSRDSCCLHRAPAVAGSAKAGSCGAISCLGR